MAQAQLMISSDLPGEEQREPFLRVTDPPPLKGLGHLGLSARLVSHILRVALPVVVGMLTQTAINILDTVMVGRLPKEIANPGQAGIGVALPMMWLVGGLLSSVWVGTQAITSRRAGEGNDRLAGRALTNSLLISGSTGLVFCLAAYYAAPPLIGALYSDAAVVALGTDYLQIRLLGVFAMAATFSFKSFFDGIGRTRVFMAVAVVMNVTNVVFNYLLIYGNETLGVPMLGVAGAAWASALAAYVGLLLLVLWSLRPALLKRYHYYNPLQVSVRVVREIVRLSLPNGLATVVVMVGFSAFYWIVGKVSDLHNEMGNPVIATANQAIITLAMVSFMSAIAFGTATATLASQSLGAGRPYLAERYGWDGVKLWAYVTWAYGAALLFAPDLMLGLVTVDPDVIAEARDPLRMVGVLQGIVAIAMTLAQTLYGLGNARYVLAVELLMHLFVMCPVAYVFGVLLDLGLMGVWLGPVAYTSILAGAVVWKFKRGDWKSIHI